MKNIRRSICVLLALIMLFGMSAAAFAADADLAPAGLCVETADEAISTVVTFENRSDYIAQGAVDFAATEQNAVIESISSFSLRYEGETILTVEPRDIAATGSTEPSCNGYYMTTFAIPDSTEECFLTGLTPQNVEKVQQELIEHYAIGNLFQIEDLDFIDAEKLSSQDAGDNLMCWAGTASNMLRYSGWGQKAGFASEDDIFESFIDAFVDEGNSSSDGIKWFFDGIIQENLKKPESGAYLTQYDAEQTLDYIYVECFDGEKGAQVTGMAQMLDRLKNGYAAEMTVAWIDATIAHAVTAWGCVTDNAYDDDVIAHYKYVIVSDSDSNEPEGTDRRVAPNTLDCHPLGEYRDKYGQPQLLYDNAYCSGTISGFDLLAPYSDDLPYETDERASRDKRKDPDFYTKSISLQSSDNPTSEIKTKVYEGDVYLFADIIKSGAEPLSDQLKIHTAVRNAGGSVVREVTDQYQLDLNSTNNTLLIGVFKQLPSGNYTVEITLNPDLDFSEAFLYNNYFSCPIEVVGDKPDLSGVAFSAEIGDYADRKINIQMDYGDLQQTEPYQQSSRVDLEYSCYSQDIWGNWISCDGLPSQINIDPCNKLRLRLVFYQDDLFVISDSVAYDIDFPLVSFPDSYNAIPVYATEKNAPRLADGNFVTFRIQNISNETIPTLSGTYRFYAKNKKTNDVVYLTEPEPIVLQNGVESDEIRFSSWTTDTPLDGDYFLYVEFISDGYQNYTAESMIAQLRTPEKESSVVDLDSDAVDAFDRKTSLREAIAYCEENGGTVTFADNMTYITLDEPISVSSNLVIDGSVENEDDQTCVNIAKYTGSSMFELQQGGSLELRRLTLSGSSDEQNGGAVYSEGGTLLTDQCLFTNCRAKNGGAVYLNGGSAVFRNTGFMNCSADRGAAVYVDKNAHSEMLNTTILDAVIRETGAIYNQSGTINLINSAVVGCKNYRVDQSAVDLVYANGKINIVNSILTDTPFRSAAGNCSIFCSAVGELGEGVTADALTKHFDNQYLILSSSVNYPKYTCAFAKALLYIKPTRFALSGCLTSASDGILSVTSEGKTTSTGIATTFSDEELHRDILGDERSAIYGPCCTLDDFKMLLGDASLDNEVDMIDATTIQRYDVGLIKINDLAVTLADVDRDDDVSIIDVTWIQRFINQMKAPAGIGEPLQTD